MPRFQQGEWNVFNTLLLFPEQQTNMYRKRDAKTEQKGAAVAHWFVGLYVGLYVGLIGSLVGSSVMALSVSQKIHGRRSR